MYEPALKFTVNKLGYNGYNTVCLPCSMCVSFRRNQKNVYIIRLLNLT